MGSVETVVDEAANIAVIDGEGRLRGRGGKGKRKDVEGMGAGAKGGVREWEKIWSRSTDAVMDVPLGGVCEVLYGGREDEDEDVE